MNHLSAPGPADSALSSIGLMAPDERADSTHPFDFDDQPGDASPAPRAAGGDGFDPFGLQTAAPSIGRVRRGQRVSGVALILVLLGALAIGIGIAAALHSVDLSAPSPFGSLLWWGTLALLGLLIMIVALVISIVAVVQAEPRVLAIIALIGAVILGWVAAYIGFKIGAHHLSLEAAREVGTTGPDAVPAIADKLRQRGVDVGPFLGILHRVFGK